MTILVTGGAGFIGSNFVLNWLSHSNENIINLDKLTYAGNLENLKSLKGKPEHFFIKGDIGNRDLISNVLKKDRPRAILNFAAESHVDRSITGPADFIETNVVGTFNLLQTAKEYWNELPQDERKSFRFLHVSTDEVYGSLGPHDPPFSETNQYQPNSPYSASKASSDHMVRAFHHTYGLPTLTTNCSNNYGPFQFPEKLIPLLISRALTGGELPIYGDGLNIRDWLYVGDHCEAIEIVLAKGKPGETYNIGGLQEKTNLDVVYALCDILDRGEPRKDGKSYREQIKFVTDRPGHDRRYAIDASKISSELGWTPKHSFDTGILKTVRWYLDHQDWISNIQSGEYLKQA